MVDLVSALFLGIVQGLTEWLPISSSGHLVIVQQIMKMNVPLFFDVILHLGTLLAVIVFFWKDILKILKSLFTLNFNSEEGKLIKFIIIGSIPVALIGYLFHDIIESFFSNLLTVGLSLIITGTFLLLTKKSKGRNELKLFDSIIIGIAQAFALIPGISRSGATISTGLFKGIDKKTVFKFSFLLSIPAIIGANLLELTKNPITQTDVLPLFVCVITSAIVGYLSLKFLYGMLTKGKFYYFSFYCFILGLFILFYSIV